MSSVTMHQMLKAGVHFGHQTRYWNPKMAPYIFGARGKIHIINLEKTLPLFNEAMQYLQQVAAKKGKIMFVGTKKAARQAVEEEAQRCGMPYVNYRWLGGMLTNFQTIKHSVSRLKELETMVEDGSMARFSKKEALGMSREQEKLQRSLGGIKDMTSLPDVIFVLDVGYEKNALKEARKLGIPLVGVVDTNHNPSPLDYMIPGNDDSIRALKLYLQSASTAILKGQSEGTDGTPDNDEFIEEGDNPQAEA